MHLIITNTNIYGLGVESERFLSYTEGEGRGG